MTAISTEDVHHRFQVEAEEDHQTFETIEIAKDRHRFHAMMSAIEVEEALDVAVLHFGSRACHLEVVVVFHLVEEAHGMIEEEDVNLLWMNDLHFDRVVGHRHPLDRIIGNDHPFEISVSHHQDTTNGDLHHDEMMIEV